MQVYRTQVRKLPGTNFTEVSKKAFNSYKLIKNRSKRRPYIRSVYFKKQKVFLPLFWHHLHEKENLKDKTRRIKYFPCAIELIKNTNLPPVSKENPNRRDEILHRFTGLTPDNEFFCVQIKEDKKTSQKWLISVFPLNKK